MKSVLSLWTFLVCLLCVSTLDRHRNKICYKAKICVHNAVEKCGVDSKGNLRRFYDSCDILEFNCLKGTDYSKTQKDSCANLPPIEDDQSEPIENDPQTSPTESPKNEQPSPTDDKPQQNPQSVEGEIKNDDGPKENAQPPVEGENRHDDPPQENVQPPVEGENRNDDAPRQNVEAPAEGEPPKDGSQK